jgi:hypothetical protein
MIERLSGKWRNVWPIGCKLCFDWLTQWHNPGLTLSTVAGRRPWQQQLDCSSVCACEQHLHSWLHIAHWHMPSEPMNSYTINAATSTSEVEVCMAQKDPSRRQTL